MNTFHEEEQQNAKLFNREVLALLFHYILRYKKYLVISALFVLVITGVTLAVPYVSKLIIDRAIIKKGYIANTTSTYFKDKKHGDVLEKITNGVALGNGSYFLLQSHLSYFSQKQIERFRDQDIFSDKQYTLIESPDLSSGLEKKMATYISEGLVQNYENSRYTFEESVLNRFTLDELYHLRANDFRLISWYVLIIIVLFLFRFIAHYFQIIGLMKLSQNAMHDLRVDLFNHILSLKLSFFDRNPIGRLVNRVTNDIESLNEMFSSVVVTLLQDLLIMTGIAIVMFATDFYLALMVGATFPFLFIATIIFRLKARKAYRLIRTKIADLNAFLNENISGIRIVQIFSQEKRQRRKFGAINSEVYKANLQQMYTYAIFRPIIDLFRWIAVGGVLYFGAQFILSHRISYGLVVMFLAYIGSFFEPITDLAEKFDIMQSATAAGEKILSLFRVSIYETSYNEKPDALSYTITQNRKDVPPKVNVPVTHPENVPNQGTRFRGEIVFDNVWFSYAPDEWVLKGISFSLQPFQTLAIVGETGSGKTTIINLLSRLYTIQKGHILIDGNDITALSILILRQQIATVMQDVFLFSRALRDNITLGNRYDKDHFDTITRLTHTDRLIRSLPKGINEPVMERGSTFSAGERQLLAFARALYADPSILIFDEATSNIDSETEVLIQDAIRHIIKGRTSIMIAHRLSTVRNADKIIVIEKGRIIEEGDHNSLMKQKGMYHELFRLQFESV